MTWILSIMHSINFCYIVSMVLLFIVMNLFLTTKGVNYKIRYFINLIYVIGTILSFNYVNGIFKSIFSLKYLSVKTYLFIIMLTNAIVLFTINKKVKLGYKIANFTLFIVLTIIFGSTLSIVLGNKFDALYVMDISNAVNFIDLSLVIFILYIILMTIIYIGYYLFNVKDETEEKKPVTSKKSWEFKKISNLINLKKKQEQSSSLKNQNHSPKQNLLTPEELLQYNRENGLYINGVECSIIFEDSNQENIVKNYYILQNDIHAKLVNGYTLEENRMLKNICMKLQVGNIGNIDIHNISILNKISVEEYNLLKKIFLN